jgi:S1-C subfamily serine protease
MVRLLMRSGNVQAIGQVDEHFQINGDVHTNVIAGLALDDGETIAAWLPEVDAEVGLATTVPSPGATGQQTQTPGVRVPLPGFDSGWQGFGSFYEAPDVTVVRDRKQVRARYVGLDGMTGVSILRLAKTSVGEGQRNTATDANEEKLSVGHHVRLLSPRPTAEKETNATTAVYVAIGEIEGEVINVLQSPSGTIGRIEVRSPKVTSANIGGVAINETGETIGIVDSVKGTDATILPTSVIRGAAKRVLARRASVPRPWLGVRGEALGAFSMDQLTRNGWQPELWAKTWADAKRGLLVTSVAPGSPASQAALTPGDLILNVNEAEVRNADDFSLYLAAAGPEGLLRFTIARPGKAETEYVEVKLAEAPDPFFGLRVPRTPLAPPRAPTAPPAPLPGAATLTYSLLLRGVETVTVKPRFASRFGSTGGLLVVYVQPATAAFKSGLRPGDVIEAIDGQKVSTTAQAIRLPEKTDASYSFSVIRNKQKLEFMVTSQD